MYHTVANQGQSLIASALGVNPYFVKDYAEAARNYPLKFSTKIISILKEIDLKSKGLGAVNIKNNKLLKEMVYKIVNIDKIKS